MRERKAQPGELRVEDQRTPTAKVVLDLLNLISPPRGGGWPELDDSRNMNTGWEKIDSKVPYSGPESRAIAQSVLGTAPVTFQTTLRRSLPMHVRRGTGELVAAPETPMHLRAPVPLSRFPRK